MELETTHSSETELKRKANDLKKIPNFVKKSKFDVNCRDLKSIKTFMKSNQRLKVSDSVTQEMLEDAIKIADRPSHAKILITRIEDGLEKKFPVGDLISGKTKFATKEEIKKFNIKKRPKGTTVTTDSSNLAIEEISKIIEPELRAVKTVGSSRIDGIFLKKDDNEFQTNCAFFSICISNLSKEGRKLAQSGKTIKKILQYLKIGSCFIFVIRVNAKIECVYFISPLQLNELLESTKFAMDKGFSVSPFRKKNLIKNSVTALFDKFIIMKGDSEIKFHKILKQKIIEFEKFATIRHTLHYLNNDKSMLCFTHQIEAAYMRKLSKILPEMKIVENQQGKIIFILNYR